jgi:methylenetetrahydrofolate dehydrogenase (NADP+)/methenyltetrahydrofolate cyclohydrolase
VAKAKLNNTINKSHHWSIIKFARSINLNLKELTISRAKFKKIKRLALSGSDMVSYIKLNQQRLVRAMLQGGVKPSLDIIIGIENNLPIEKYVEFKIQYGLDIGVDVRVHRAKSSGLITLIDKLNKDVSVRAIILQLPIDEQTLLDEAISLIDINKDVDGLNPASKFDSATATAIMWLISGYNINLESKKIYIVGHGKLVGSPLATILTASGLSVNIINAGDDLNLIKDGDLIISATGRPGLITTDLIKPGAIVIDAGTTAEEGTIRGDASDELYLREDISITPKIGGVGPLTISALFSNVIKAHQSIPSRVNDEN